MFKARCSMRIIVSALSVSVALLAAAATAACGGAAQEPAREGTSTAPTAPGNEPTALGEKTNQRCGGPGTAMCPSGYACMDDPNDVCDPKKDGSGCAGICMATSCGASASCAGGFACVDDPNDSCDPNSTGATCPGICVASKLERCGGLANQKCPAGKHCIDDVGDSCNPKLSPDCPGLCVP